MHESYAAPTTTAPPGRRGHMDFLNDILLCWMADPDAAAQLPAWLMVHTPEWTFRFLDAATYRLQVM